MMVPEWVWGLIGMIITGLIGLVYKNMLTKTEHSNICTGNTEKITKSLERVIKDEIKDVKEYFDIKIENVVLKEIRKLNGRSD